MRRINGNYVLSKTDKHRIAAHCRAIARTRHYDGYVSAFLNIASGEIIYEEFVGNGRWMLDGTEIEFICSADCHADW